MNRKPRTVSKDTAKLIWDLWDIKDDLKSAIERSSILGAWGHVKGTPFIRNKLRGAISNIDEVLENIG